LTQIVRAGLTNVDKLQGAAMKRRGDRKVD